jgi:type I restriction enzyme R subunit
MSPEISEYAFEEAIERALLQFGPDAYADDETARELQLPYGDYPPGGYHKRKSDEYDRALGLLPRDVVDFVLATQPKQWKKLGQHHGDGVKDQFLRRLASEITRRGALDVLRTGLKDSGCQFRLAYFLPSSGLNDETRRLHAANLFSVVRQRELHRLGDLFERHPHLHRRAQEPAQRPEYRGCDPSVQDPS